MRELDVVLERWLLERYPSAREDERQAFARLLQSQDPQLVAWLFGRERPDDPAVAALVDEIAAGGPRSAG
jgi:antitoxin CptB